MPFFAIIDPVTWHGINNSRDPSYTVGLSKQGKSDWTGMSSFVVEVPLCNLCRSMSVIYSVPCDWIVQRAY